MYIYPNCELVKVKDGDTIVLNVDLGFNCKKENVVVRLLDIDTPEIRLNKKNKINKLHKVAGLLVKNYVYNILQESKIITLQSIKPDWKNNTDSFGRVLGNIILNNTFNLSEHLLRKRFAIKYNKKKRYKFSKSILNHIINYLFIK